MFYPRRKTIPQQIWEQRIREQYGVHISLHSAYALPAQIKYGPDIVLMPRGRLGAHYIMGMRQPGYMEGELHLYPANGDTKAGYLMGDMKILGFIALQTFFDEIRRVRGNAVPGPYFIKCYGWNPFPDLQRVYYTWQQRAYIQEQLAALEIIPDYSVSYFTEEQARRLLAAIL